MGILVFYFKRKTKMNISITKYMLTGIKYARISNSNIDIYFTLPSQAEEFFKEWVKEIKQEEKLTPKFYREFGTAGILFHEQNGSELFVKFVNDIHSDLEEIILFLEWLANIAKEPIGNYIFTTKD